jgi:hypothetical protein
MSLDWAFATINRAGDTILIHGGDYYGHHTLWASGDEGNPLVVMPYNNEVVRMIGEGAENMTLSIMGNFTVVRDLIITQTERNRASATNESWPDDIDTEIGLTIGGEGVKLLNSIIYNVYSNGLGSSSNGVDVEISGCIIFNAGWRTLSRGAGHGMYLSNNEGEKTIRKNIIFNSYGHGIQFYTEGSQKLIGSTFEDNIIFNAGVPSSSDGVGVTRNFMMGGNAPISDMIIRGNHTYFPVNSSGTGMHIGYNTVNESCIIKDNYIVRGEKVFVMHRFKSTIMQNNTIIGKKDESLASVFFPEDVALRGEYNWDMNSYIGEEESFFYANDNATLNLEDWQDQLDFDQNSSFEQVAGMKNHIKVIPNDYQEGRAHVVVYNWENQDEVSIDLGDIMERNDTYIIYDVENVFEPLLSGVYNGESVEIPMHLSEIIQPTGEGVYLVDHTSSEFGVFLVTSAPGDDVLTESMTAQTPEKSDLIIYPNDARGTINFEFQASQAGSALLQLFDMSGRSVLARNQSVMQGGNNILLDVSELNQGIYILSVDNNGSRKTSKVQIN